MVNKFSSWAEPDDELSRLRERLRRDPGYSAPDITPSGRLGHRGEPETPPYVPQPTRPMLPREPLPDIIPGPWMPLPRQEVRPTTPSRPYVPEPALPHYPLPAYPEEGFPELLPWLPPRGFEPRTIVPPDIPIMRRPSYPGDMREDLIPGSIAFDDYVIPRVYDIPFKPFPQQKHHLEEDVMERHRPTTGEDFREFVDEYAKDLNARSDRRAYLATQPSMYQTRPGMGPGGPDTFVDKSLRDIYGDVTSGIRSGYQAYLDTKEKAIGGLQVILSKLNIPGRVADAIIQEFTPEAEQLAGIATGVYDNIIDPTVDFHREALMNAGTRAAENYADMASAGVALGGNPYRYPYLSNPANLINTGAATKYAPSLNPAARMAEHLRGVRARHPRMNRIFGTTPIASGIHG